jgi:hypothetical protein
VILAVFTTPGYPDSEERREIGIRRGNPGPAKARQLFLTSDQLYYGMTAVLEFDSRQVRLVIMDPLGSDRIVVAGRSYPLAADLPLGQPPCWHITGRSDLASFA